MMYGIANVDFKGVDTTSASAQTITSDAEKTIKFAQEQTIPVSIHGLVASTVGLGTVGMEAIYKDGSAVKGYIPAINKNASVSSGKVTFSSPS